MTAISASTLKESDFLNIRLTSEPVAWMVIAPGVVIEVKAMPSLWARFWQRVLLGWTYRGNP